MVEVFKTNVNSVLKAEAVLEQIHSTFAGYKASFDLEDCDRILRVQADTEIPAFQFILFLKGRGVEAEILPDVVLPKKEELKINFQYVETNFSTLKYYYVIQ